MILYEIWLETWEILREAGIAATVNWATDDSWRYEQFSRLISPAFHAFTTTYPAIYARYQQDHLAHILLTQWAANGANLQPPLPGAECQYLVSFIGTSYGQRQMWVKKLAERGIEIACFGHGWPRGPIIAAEIPQIIRSSVISLNFGSTPTAWRVGPFRQANQIKARTFEVPGAGGFLMTEWTDGLEQYYMPGQEIAVFKTLDELADQINYYLAHPAERDRIAWAGYERTRAEHTYDQRLAKVLDFAIAQREQYFTTAGNKPTGQIDWNRFKKVQQQHHLDRRLQMLRQGLAVICSRLWGPVRGPRVARRLIFELSWRLRGSHTYSAAGWPGRMFYHES
jgi:spore maturation protein CgeB